MQLFILFSYLMTIACGWIDILVFTHFAPLGASHATGNADRLAISILSGDWSLIWAIIGVILAFVVGSAISSLVNPKGSNNFSSVFSWPFLIVSIGLIFMSFFFYDMYILAFYCSILAGYQNGFMSQFGIRVSHLSGCVTDSGLELGRFFRSLSRHERFQPSVRKTLLGSFLLKLIYIVFFVFGAALSLIIDNTLGVQMSFLFLSFLNIALAIFYIFICKYINNKKADATIYD